MAGLTFRQLEVLVAVVEAGSLRACAEQLGISQMAVSEHVRTLERQLGRPLFQRRRGAVATPTPAGHEACVRARRILAEARALAEGEGDSGPARARLRIGAHGYIVERISRRLARFGAEHPDLALELERRSFEGVAAGLEDGEIDVGFFLSHGPAAELDGVLAWREALALYAGPSHPLAERADVSAADLHGFPFVQLPAKSHMRRQVDAALAGLRLDRCPVALVSDDLALILENLGAGQSFACLFAAGADELVAQGRLVRLPVREPIGPLDVRYAAPGRGDLEPLVAELTRALP